MEHKLTNVQDIRTFVLAGNATFTLKSLKSGQHFTFRVKAPVKENRVDLASDRRFVSVMTGRDNETDYSYLGFFAGNTYRHGGAKAKVDATSASARAFAYLCLVLQAQTVPATLEFWASARCCRCNRTLTRPGSVKRFLGDECAEIMGFVAQAA